MLNLAGYNIGTFVLPFTQNFLGSMGVIATSLFDTGNAIIYPSGAYSLASMVKNGDCFSIMRIVKSLATSIPFMTYIIMVIMNLSRIPVPKIVLSLAEIISNANAFMAMLMIGVGFKLQGNRSQIRTIAKMLIVRYGIATILALIYYFVLPLDIEVRRALVILAFSPISSAVPGFTGEMNGDVGLSSALNSISIIISIVIVIVLLSVML